MEQYSNVFRRSALNTALNMFRCLMRRKESLHDLLIGACPTPCGDCLICHVRSLTGTDSSKGYSQDSLEAIDHSWLNMLTRRVDADATGMLLLFLQAINAQPLVSATTSLTMECAQCPCNSRLEAEWWIPISAPRKSTSLAEMLKTEFQEIPSVCKTCGGESKQRKRVEQWRQFIIFEIQKVDFNTEVDVPQKITFRTKNGNVTAFLVAAGCLMGKFGSSRWYSFLLHNHMWIRANDFIVKTVKFDEMKRNISKWGRIIVYEQESCTELIPNPEPEVKTDESQGASNATIPSLLTPKPSCRKRKRKEKPTAAELSEAKKRRMMKLRELASSPIPCKKCGNYILYRNMPRHVRQNCKGKVTFIDASRGLSCGENNKVSWSATNKESKGFRCDCGQVLSTRNILLRHVLNQHEGKYTCARKFSSINDFETWMRYLSETCNFVKKNNMRKNRSYRFYEYFVCSRRGCSVFLNVRIMGAEVTVTGYLKHSHPQSLQNLRMTQDCKVLILGSIKQGMKNEEILQSIRSRFIVGTRDFATTTRDIIRLRRDFRNGKVENLERQVNNVGDAIRQEEDSTDSPYVLRKEIGESKRGFDDSDYALVIMTPAQRVMWRKFAQNCICVDSTHKSMTMHDLKLVTILVVGQHDQGLPAAFFLVSEESHDLLSQCFKAIRKAVGPITTDFFMYDGFRPYYDSFCDHFSTPNHKLLSEWHTHRRWRYHVFKLIASSWAAEHQKKQQEELVRQTLLRLYDIQYAMTERSIRTAIMDLRSYLRAHSLPTVYRYILRNYLSRKAEWISFYRYQSKENTNMHVEPLHKQVKLRMEDSFEALHIETLISRILAFLRESVVKTYISLERGEYIRKRSYSILKAHRVALKEFYANCVVRVNDRTFRVSNGSMTHVVTMMRKYPCCMKMCKRCSICRHMFSCDCKLPMFTPSICKHVHALCLYSNFIFGDTTSEPENRVEDPPNRASTPDETSADEDERTVNVEQPCVSRTVVSDLPTTEVAGIIEEPSENPSGSKEDSCEVGAQSDDDNNVELTNEEIPSDLKEDFEKLTKQALEDGPLLKKYLPLLTVAMKEIVNKRKAEEQSLTKGDG